MELAPGSVVFGLTVHAELLSETGYQCQNHSQTVFRHGSL